MYLNVNCFLIGVFQETLWHISAWMCCSIVISWLSHYLKKCCLLLKRTISKKKPLWNITKNRNAPRFADVLLAISPLQWRHNGRNGVSNHQPHHCLLNRLLRRRSKKTSELRVTGLCVGNSPGTGEFPAQMASCAENVFISWRHHDCEWLIVINLLILIVVVSLLLGKSYDHPMTAKLKNGKTNWYQRRESYAYFWVYIIFSANVTDITTLL